MEKESKNLSISDESEKKAKAISDIFEDAVFILGAVNKELGTFASAASKVVDICKNIKKVAEFIILCSCKVLNAEHLARA